MSREENDRASNDLHSAALIFAAIMALGIGLTVVGISGSWLAGIGAAIALLPPLFFGWIYWLTH